MSDFAVAGANAFLGGTALPTTLYMQMHTGNPGPAGTSNVAAVSTREGFTRSAPSGGVCTNATEIQWLDVPNTEDITHITLWGSASGGICWFIDDVVDKSIFTGDSVTVVVGGLTISFPVWA